MAFEGKESHLWPTQVGVYYPSPEVHADLVLLVLRTTKLFSYYQPPRLLLPLFVETLKGFTFTSSILSQSRLL